MKIPLRRRDGLGHPPPVRRLGRVTLALSFLVAGGAARAHVGIHELSRALDGEIARHPEDGPLHLERAKAHLVAREWDAALRELDAAAAHGADPDLVGTTRGQALLEAGRPRAARASLDRVLRRRPDAWGTLFERGRAWLALGSPRRAADDFGRAIAHLHEPRPEQVIARRDALLSLGRRADALRALDEGMARIGHVASLELAAIDLEVALGRPTRALGRLDGLLAATPGNPAWVARRAELLARAGREAEARAEWARALAMIEARPAARRSRAFEELRRRIEIALGASAREDRR
jgi:tetratricopeptide (TPR) repeat protein